MERRRNVYERVMMRVGMGKLCGYFGIYGFRPSFPQAFSFFCCLFSCLTTSIIWNYISKNASHTLDINGKPWGWSRVKSNSRADSMLLNFKRMRVNFIKRDGKYLMMKIKVIDNEEEEGVKSTKKESISTLNFGWRYKK